MHLRLFGLHIYVSRKVLKPRGNYDRNRRAAKLARRQHVDNECELCGCQLQDNCTMYHLLPPGNPKRSELEHLRVVCPTCSQTVKKNGIQATFNDIYTIEIPLNLAKSI